MRRYLAILFLTVVLALGAQAQMKVASLHPLLTEMAQVVGGEALVVVDLFPPNGELHDFEPQPGDVAAAAGSRLLLACGKGVEPYLAGLKDSLSADTKLVELGNDVPDAALPGGRGNDPHWWNCPANMKRAARSLATALAAADPAHAETYRSGSRKYAAEMDKLDREARLALSAIPAERRVLATGHAAMCHFCVQYGFTPIPVYGIAKESQGDTAGMARLLAELRAHGVRCLFHEWSESPRAMESLAAQTGATTRPLILDGICPDRKGYAAIFRENVRNIVAGLADAPAAGQQ